MTFFGTLETPVGMIGVESDGEAITRVTWLRVPQPPGSTRDPILSEALRELRAYFAGDLRRFEVPVALPARPDTTNSVLRTLHGTVSCGESVTYAELAARSGGAVPARAIGSIMGANPIPIIVPCHRVVASDGLGGYSGGTPGQGRATKRWLLAHEGALPPALF
jgi:methylated-DNA-[protein]-cysteine S-methyltransferase